MTALPPPQVERCIGRIDPSRPLLFTVLAKRTFEIKGQIPVPAGEQEPFCTQEEGVATDDPGNSPLRRAPEITPDRDFCDVVVLGTARRSTMVTTADLLFTAPGISRRIRVMGDRFVQGTPGTWRFTPPEPWQEMPLGWDRAYGGIDRGVLPNPEQKESVRRALLCHPGAYPRNDIGRGFSLKGSCLPSDGMPLPNLEDTKDFLTPERFECPGPRYWHLQPIPVGLGYVPAHWFPRSVCVGVVAGEWPKRDGRLIREEEIGSLPQGFVQAQREAGVEGATISPLFFQVSAPGMRTRLRGDERFALQGLEGNTAIVLDLPGGVPKMVVEGPSGSVDLVPKLFQVLWDLDENRLAMVWGASEPLAGDALKGLSEKDPMELPVRVL
jgi:hypothetical protein